MRSLISKILAFVPLLLLLTLWQLVGSSSSRMSFLYSTPTSVLSTLLSELATRAFWMDIGVTSSEVIGGLILGNALGTGLALVLWLYPRMGDIFRPYVIALSSIPIFAVMPLFILWFGIGFGAKIAIVVFSTVFVALAYALTAAVGLGQKYEEIIFSFGGTRADLLRKVIVPGVVSRSFVAYRMNVSFALIGAYVAEWVSAKQGLGQYILRATSLYDVPHVWAGLIVFIAIAFLLYQTMAAVERKVVPFKETS